MAMLDVVSYSSLQVGLRLRLKSTGLVQRSAAVWRCSAFIAWTGWTHAMTLMVTAPQTLSCMVIMLLVYRR